MRPLRVLLVNVGRRTLAFPFTTPPVGLLYLAGYLRKQLGVEARIINQRECDRTADEIVREAIDLRPDVIGLGALTTAAQALYEMSRKMRKACPDALLVLGGPHFSAARESALQSSDADAGVVGEGELGLEAVIQARFDGGDFARVPGLIWRDSGGQIVTNPGSIPLIEDLDSLPMPAYDLIDLPRYWRLQSLPPIARRRYVSLFTTRGCPYHCIWCHNIFGKRYRVHSPERVMEEVRFFTRKYEIDDLEFLDDCFNLKEDRVLQICEGMQRLNPKVSFCTSNGLRTDLLTQETVDAMTAAGWYYSIFPLETASARLQEFTGKRLDIGRYIAGVEMAAATKKVFANGVAMLGHPTETEEEIRSTIDTMVDSPLHVASFMTVTPFPHTRLYDICRERCPERLEGIHYEDVTFGSIRVNLSAVPDEVLFRYQRLAYRRFYLSPRRIWRIVRDYPRRYMLPYFIPVLIDRMSKGLLGGERT